jgi:hypothetical protein
MNRLWTRPNDFAFLKVSEVVDGLMIELFGSQMALRNANNPNDIKVLLAHHAVYGGICDSDLLYLRCAYEDCCIDGWIGGQLS